MSERFYVADSLAVGPYAIVGAEAHHLAQVLRLQVGSAITLFNGDGQEYAALVESVHKNQVAVSIEKVQAVSRERARSITIACPLPKGDRAAFLIEKLTELGVACYIPLKTQRSVVHPGEGKMDKLHRYVIEASKQCGRNILMAIEPMRPWSEVVGDTTLPGERYVADTTAGTSWSADAQSPCIIALGPEGGWTKDELALAQQHHWQSITLGPAILRIETAALAAAILSA